MTLTLYQIIYPMKQEFTVKKLMENIYWIWEFYHPERVISFLVVWQERCLLIDTWMWLLNIKNEIRKITKLPITVINTHLHWDHIWGNYLFDEILLFDYSISKKIAKNWISNEDLTTKYDNIPNAHFIQKFNYDWIIKKWEIIKIHPFNFKILHTPWHSQDSISLYEENEWILFCGDVLYEWTIYVENVKQYINSINYIKLLETKFIFWSHNTFNNVWYLIKK